MTDRLHRTDAEWRARLTDEQFRVTRRGGTEQPFTGEHWDRKNDGAYLCVCCGLALFASTAKFESGTGWPSFHSPAAQDRIGEREDRKFFMRRTEVACARCDAHLGHVFADGPRPTGLRYCINSASLIFEAAGTTEAVSESESAGTGAADGNTCLASAGAGAADGNTCLADAPRTEVAPGAQRAP